MTPENSYIWIVMRLRFGPTAVWVDYADSRGGRRRSQATTSAESPGWLELPALGSVRWRRHWRGLTAYYNYKIRIPKDFADLVSGLLEDLPSNLMEPHADRQVPLAVFFEVSPGMDDLSNYWPLAVLSLALPHASPKRFQLVRLPGHMSRAGRFPLLASFASARHRRRMRRLSRISSERLVGAGNPLAFIFNCLGNSEIKLIKPAA